MRYILSAVVAMLWLQPAANACDVCGCGVGGAQYTGVMPQFTKHFIGLRYQYMRFRSETPPSLLDDGAQTYTSDDLFHRAELYGRYYLHRRIQLTASLPYSHNRREEYGSAVSVSGLGDAIVGANVVLFNTTDSLGKRLRHTWLVSAQVKLPTGDYKREHDANLLNAHFQLGTGSMDYLFNTTYTVRYNRFGVAADAGYRLNTVNDLDYRFGDRMTAGLRGFYWLKRKETLFLPTAGLQFEHFERDIEGRFYRDNTGGQAALATAGLDVYYKQVAVGAAVQLPVYQDFAQGQVDARPRLSANVIVLF